MNPRALFIVPSHYDELVEKGVAWMIRERDENGYFARVVTVHPLAFQRRTLALDPVHAVHEFPLRRLLGRQEWWIPLLFLVRVIAVTAAVVRIAHRERVDLIRATDPYLMGLMALAAGWILRIPVAVSLHADYAKTFLVNPKTGPAAKWRRLGRFAPRFVLRRADMVLPIGHSLARWAVQNGASPARVRVVSHGVDVPPLDEPPPAELMNRLPLGRGHLLSFAGRLSKDLYCGDLIEIVRRLAAARNDFVVVIAGDGPERETMIADLARTPALAERVLFLGFLPHEQVLALRRLSAVSLVLIGGFSLLEACAAASPVVAYDVDWLSEVVENGVTGILVPEHDVAAAVRGIETLLDRPGEAARIGAAARARVEEQYSKERAAATKRACYEHLLAKKGSGSRP